MAKTALHLWVCLIRALIQIFISKTSRRSEEDLRPNFTQIPREVLTTPALPERLPCPAQVTTLHRARSRASKTDTTITGVRGSRKSWHDESYISREQFQDVG